MFKRILISIGSALAMHAVQAAEPVILVFGDSLSAGYGIAAEQAWPKLLEKELARQGKKFRVVNASVSGETTAGGLTRFPASLKQHQPQWVILALGANDGLRGLPVAGIKNNLATMISQAQKSGAKVHLIGMQMPPNYGASYTQQFAAVYPALAKQYQLSLSPFLLAPIIDQDRYFQADQLHPTASAQALLLKYIQQQFKP
ncbi:arylesterase [Chitinibacter fontanus]|uniref:Arylesterase n=1 Tax=Chitinibacter fontanus TaxID=1737446 RepID=A0A7D5VAJ1_9NEIS|nr:arylesterase [Chitinibacter fontanus]QLI82317.1 arylesterase [Chitinibacter fontanus]